MAGNESDAPSQKTTTTVDRLCETAAEIGTGTRRIEVGARKPINNPEVEKAILEAEEQAKKRELTD